MGFLESDKKEKDIMAIRARRNYRAVAFSCNRSLGEEGLGGVPVNDRGSFFSHYFIVGEHI
jgi:hypothetical protein